MKQQAIAVFTAVLVTTSIAHAAPVLSSTQTINLAPVTVNNDGSGGIGALVASIGIAAPTLKGVNRNALTLTANFTFTSSYDVVLTDLFPGGNLSTDIGVEFATGGGIGSAPGDTPMAFVTANVPFGYALHTSGSTSDPYSVSFSFAVDPSVSFKTDNLFTLNINANAQDLSGVPLSTFSDQLAVTGTVTISGPAAPIPEPAAIALFGLGALALVASRRRV